MDIPHYLSLGVIAGIQLVILAAVLHVTVNVATLCQAIKDHDRRLTNLEHKS